MVFIKAGLVFMLLITKRQTVVTQKTVAGRLGWYTLCLLTL